MQDKESVQQLAIELAKQVHYDISPWIDSLLEADWVAKWEYYRELMELTEVEPNFEEFLEGQGFVRNELGWFHPDLGQFGEDPAPIINELQDELPIDSLYEKSGAEGVEYWIVGEDLAKKLKEYEEKIVQIASIHVWARTQSGSVHTDTVIQEIAAEMCG